MVTMDKTVECPGELATSKSSPLDFLSVESRSIGANAARVLCAFLLLAAVVGFSDQASGKVRKDFTEYSLAAARVMFAGGNPYNKAETGQNFKYLPANAVLLYPWTKLPNCAAQGAWVSLNLLLLVACMKAHGSFLARTRVPWWVWGLALAVSLRFMVMCFRLGQWNLPVYSLAFLGVVLLHRGRLAGAWLLGLSAVLKYMPAFFIVFLLARRKWTQALAVTAAIVFWAFVMPTLVLGPQRHAELLRSYKASSAKFYAGMTEGKTVSSVSVRAYTYRLLTPAAVHVDKVLYFTNVADLPRKTAKHVATGVALVILLAAAGFVAWKSRFPLNDSEALLLIGLWFCVLLMISPEVRNAQLLTLFTPTFALAALSWKDNLRMNGLAGVGLAACLLMLPAELIDGSTWQNCFEVWGTPTFGMMLLAGNIVWRVRTTRMKDEG